MLLLRQGTARGAPCPNLSSAPCCAICGELEVRLQKAVLVDRDTVRRYREEHWTSVQERWAAEEALRSTRSAIDQAERVVGEHVALAHATSFFIYFGIPRQSLMNGYCDALRERIVDLEIRSMAAQSAWMKAQLAKGSML
jgi:hypothetical protein